MTAQYLTEPLKVGTVVKIRNSGYHRAKIAEFLGPLGPKGAASTAFLSKGSPGAFISRSLKTNSRCWTARESRQSDGRVEWG